MIYKGTDYPLVDDSWNLDYRLTDNPEAIAPLGPIGTLITREEWEAKKRAIDLFYSAVADETIAEFNEAVRRQYQHEYDEAHRTIPRPTPKRQRPTTGYVYIMRSALGHFKIGKAKDPWSRTRTIGTQHAYEIELVYVAMCLDYSRVETALHEALAEYRMNGEWFDLPIAQCNWLWWHEWVDDCGLRSVVSSCERQVGKMVTI